MAQIAEIGSADDAALWAYANMRAKNSLTPEDAGRVEEAFQAKLAAFAGAQERLSSKVEDLQPHADSLVHEPAEGPSQVTAPRPSAAAAAGAAGTRSRCLPTPSKPSRSRRAKSGARIDKGVLAFPEPRRVRDREHVRFVAKQPCLVCGRIPSDPHHLRFTQTRALGRKVSDEFTVPLCRGHHREVHRCGNEAAWWSKVAIEPTAVARALWLKTHPLPTINATPSARLEVELQVRD